MQEEIEKYYRSKNTLAEMMGRKPETFSQKDVEVHYDTLCLWFRIVL